MSLKIVNIIASAKIGGSINLELLLQKLPKAEYNPKIFPGLVFKRQGYPTIIMFKSGKISSHGSKTEKKAINAIKDIIKEIDMLDCVSGSSDIDWIRIENVVASTNLFRKIDLEKIYFKLPSMYEPEQFPGLIYKPYNDSTTCLIFSTGRMVIVGAKSEKKIYETFEIMKDRI